MEHKERVERHMEQKAKYYVSKIVKVIFFIVLGLVLAFLIGYLVMWLWNWLMPELFGLPQVGYWQAVGILVLAKIIFGFGGGNGPGKRSTSKKRNQTKKCGTLRRDFSDWKYYDEFWK
ncbi:MAG: hypothetical protein AAFO99_05070, partial [Bacteroidota bacterium]